MMFCECLLNTPNPLLRLALFIEVRKICETISYVEFFPTNRLFETSNSPIQQDPGWVTSLGFLGPRSS